MSTAVADPLLGRLLDGRYEIRSRIATGGMATVYAAIDSRLDRPVAVKVMHPALAADEEFVARFRREAKSAARLSAPTVVNVTDQGQDGGSVFLVMELVEGQTLRDVLRSEGALPPEEALAILSPVLEALAVAHGAGYVHRDVKPENVLLADDGRIKVGDFGLARAVDASPLTATTGLLLGTVAYLAPEQVRRGVADARTDVYACGVLLFEVLTGRPPFEGDTALSVAYQHLHDRVPAPSTLRPGLPEELDDLVLYATEPDPDERPSHADELLREVRRLAPAVAGGTNGRRPIRKVPVVGDDEAQDTEDLVAVERPNSRTTRLLRDTYGNLHDPKPGAGAATAAAPEDRDDEDANDADPVEDDGDRGQRLRWIRPSSAGWFALLLVTLLAIGGAWLLAVGRGVAVPNTAGLAPAAAEQTLATSGFRPRFGTSAYSETAPRGSIAGTDPASGSRARKGSIVSLLTSLGPERYTLLNTAGQPFDQAVRTLGTQKLQPGEISRAFSDTVPANSVISTSPGPGAVLRPGDKVALTVSDGPAPVTAPNVTGQPATAAQPALQGLGLKVQRQGVFNDTVPVGQVLALQPATNLHRGQPVTLVVSLGPELIAVPDVRGEGRSGATQALQDAGFTVKALSVPGFDGHVVGLAPGAGTRLRRGSSVTILLAP